MSFHIVVILDEKTNTHKNTYTHTQKLKTQKMLAYP